MKLALRSGLLLLAFASSLHAATITGEVIDTFCYAKVGIRGLPHAACGIHGKGFMQGTQAKLEYLPARHTDFIFAVLGEEWGFIGVVIVLGLYLFLILQALSFAKHARDRGGTFLVICLVSFFIFHILINVSMQIGVLPTTGIPLPLLSYGGSSTMMFLIAIGLMLNVDMRRFVNE